MIDYRNEDVDVVTIICRWDYLIISNEDGQRFGVYCGERTGKKVLVTGDLVVIKFHSDSSAPRRGFLMVFTAVTLGRHKNDNIVFSLLLYPYQNRGKLYAGTFNVNNFFSHSPANKLSDFI